MKLILSIAFVCAAFQVTGQIKIVPEDVRYVSRWDYSELFPDLDVGKKILFKQNCIPDIPAEFPTGTIRFDNVKLNGETMIALIEFQDTVVKTVTLFFSVAQKKLLNELGYEHVVAHATPRKGHWNAVEMNGRVASVIYAERKKITIIKTLVP